MRPQSQTPPLLSQFLDQNRVSVKSLRDFKQTAIELIHRCKIKSIIHPLLADHVFREAERFLAFIDMFEGALTGANKRVVLSHYNQGWNERNRLLVFVDCCQLWQCRMECLPSLRM